MFPIRHTHTLYGALILLSCVGQGAGLPAAGLRAYVRVAATTTITHMRPLWDNSLLRMSVCASLPEQRTDYKCALVVCGGLVTRTEVGLRTHVECGLPRVSRVLGLVCCLPFSPIGRAPRYHLPAAAVKFGSTMRHCGLRRGASPPHTHMQAHKRPLLICVRRHHLSCVCISVHPRMCPGTGARPRVRTSVLVCGHAGELACAHE